MCFPLAIVTVAAAVAAAATGAATVAVVSSLPALVVFYLRAPQSRPYTSLPEKNANPVFILSFMT